MLHIYNKLKPLIYAIKISDINIINFLLKHTNKY